MKTSAEQPILKRLIETKTWKERDFIYLLLEFETTEPRASSASFYVTVNEVLMHLSRINPLKHELQKIRDSLREESWPAWDEAATALLAEQ